MALNLRLGNAVRSAADKAVQSRATDGFLAPGQEVEISNARYSGTEALTMRGFAVPEEDGVWSTAAVARVDVRMRAAKVNRRYRVVIGAMLFQVPGHRALVAISVNGGPPNQVLGSGAGWMQIEADCQLGKVGRSPGVSIEFQIANPMSPNALNMGDDHRLLGLKLRSIRIVDIGLSAGAESDEEEDAAPVVNPSGVDVPSAAAVEELSPPRSPGEVIHALASRGPLWRKVLIDRNPLVRIARWMRRVTRSLQGMQQQLDLIRLDSARQTRELAQRVSEIELDAAAKRAEHERVMSGGDAIMQQLQQNHARLMSIDTARGDHAQGLGALASSTSDLARNYDQFVETLRKKQQTQQAMVEAFDAVDARMRTLDERMAQLRTDHERRFGMGVGELTARQADLLDLMNAVDHRWRESHAALHDSMQKVVDVSISKGRSNDDAAALARLDDLVRSIAVAQTGLGESLQEQADQLSNLIAHGGAADPEAASLPAMFIAAHEKLDAIGLQTAQAVDVLVAAHEKLDAQRRGLEALPAMVSSHATGNRRVLRAQHGWLIATGFGYFSCDEHDDLLAMCLAEFGDVERGLRLFLEAVLAPGDFFVDVGANIGLHTVVAARRVGREGRVVAVEAMPRTVQHLRTSLRLSGVEDRVTVFPFAAGARDEVGHAFHIASVAGHSSLYPLDEETVEEVRVDIRTLDGLVPAGTVKLVKIDVEGAELDVIAGMTRLIEQNPHVGIIAEYAESHLARVGTAPDHWEQMRAEHGFELYLIDDLNGHCQRLSAFGELAGRVSSNILLCRDGSDVAWPGIPGRAGT
ncbi:FkbM family methyltransferase [Stenotrophomonas sp. PS02301]|uniref:FkbM family methyltransferase n=1 Tax=Stenotrophomonas sp. PS02301 TaxID=2991427 RepID=UPI00249CC7EE|nr:FkbM family methyltransferase [Stenotrophomonas sp. PS02301]